MEINSNNLLGKYRLIEEIYTSDRILVYRGQAIEQNLNSGSVVLKMLRQEYPTFNELLQFRHEYTISKNLNIAKIVRPLALEPYGHGYILVMEDFGGISLENYLKNHQLSWSEVLEIAQQLVISLHHLHEHRVIHKDLKPANILIHPQTQEIKLIDFSIASLLPKETQAIKNPQNLEGTLAYLAPEQTGRMNRGIDYRTDFYNLGVTLYELATGRLPFLAKDPLELVYCHLAKQPILPHEVQKNIPPILSAIILKLMAKNAEDRYQSALGLKHDLEQCLQQWQKTGTIKEFPLGKQDLCDRFLIPEKLYGRKEEVNTLLAAFERITKGTSEIMLVAGFSGIGKTAVINEVHKPIVRQKGYFIKGKFDQFNRNVPFLAFVQAFRHLIQQILSENQQQCQNWKTQILAALAENAQVIIEIIPELEQLLGKQPSVAELSGSAAQNRFNLLFQKFLQVFTKPEHPLVIFLDDWQWADSASLNLLQLLMNNTSYLLILGAYRDNEVSPIHPFMLTLEELQKKGVKTTTITLPYLPEKEINQLVADTLNCQVELAQKLTKLIATKTEGNPFFITQFLKALHQDKLLKFDYDLGYWQTDFTQIQVQSLTNNIVEFMAIQIQKLSPETQNILKLAACIGGQFELNTLAIVAEKSEVEVATNLWKALEEGLILPLTQTYKFFYDETTDNHDQRPIQASYQFLHDRVQQAAYSLIPETQKQITHFKIGKLLLTNLSSQAKDEHIFEIANQLNLSRAIISSQTDQEELAQLNLKAGQKAQLSAAYQAAQNYYQMGIDLLPLEAWQTHYKLIYALYRYGSEVAYLCGNFDQAEALYAVAISHAQNPLDQAVIYRIQMTQYQLQGRNAEAIVIQRQSLQLLGLTIPLEPETIQAELNQEIAQVNQFLAQQAIASILDLAKMTDETTAEILRILQILFYSAWLNGQPTLALFALAKMTSLSLQYGNSEMSPFGYVGYGLIANGMLKNAAMGYQFGKLAVEMCEQFDHHDVRGMTNFFFAADVHSWSRPLREADFYYENAFKYGMNAGNWLTVGFMMMLSGSDRLTYGKNLEELYAIATTHADFLRSIKSLENLDALRAGVVQPIRQLLGLTKTLFDFDDESFSETEYLDKYRHAPYHLAWLYSVKIRHAYLFDQPTLYANLIPKLSIIENTIPTHAKVPSTVFYVALMHLTLIDISGDESLTQSHWQALTILEAKLNHWQKDCPENIRHKYLLVQAEKARIKGKKSKAIYFYEEAIAAAQAANYIYEEAIANELAAKFYLDWHKQKLAAGYMQEAYYCYAHWGAKAKIAHLEENYPQLLTVILQPDQLVTRSSLTITNRSIKSTSGDQNLWLDFPALMKAAQAISREIELEKLLATLMEIALTNAGAQIGDLILYQNEQWLIVAQTQEGETKISAIPLDQYQEIPHSLIYSVINSQKMSVFDHLATVQEFATDRYIMINQPKSVLCIPIIRQAKLMGILYLENNLTVGAFTSDRLEILNFLVSQAAISLLNANLYQQIQNYSRTLEMEVERKTQALQQKADDLAQALRKLQSTQTQLIQAEKMSSLGQLVAGIAHEINNPISFIHGNIIHTKNYLNDLISLLILYQEEYPEPSSAIQTKQAEIEIDFLLPDLDKMLESMSIGSDRIKQIVQSLRNFARLDESESKLVDIHSGLDSTLLILQHRLQTNDDYAQIKILKKYSQLPLVNCYPSALNQVFMNIINNAIDALEKAQKSDPKWNKEPTIIIETTMENSQHLVIRIADNGLGVDSSQINKIFDPFFTTKPVGKGTGLGLSISYAIIVEKHHGDLSCVSITGGGTEFIIKIPI